MMTIRDHYTFINPTCKDIDYRQFEDLVTAAACVALPGKKLMVFATSFSVPELSRGEAIAFGRALAKYPELTKYRVGKKLFSVSKTFCDTDGIPVNRERFYQLAAEINRRKMEEYDLCQEDNDESADW